MREIKFRAWDKAKKQMFFDVSIDINKKFETEIVNKGTKYEDVIVVGVERNNNIKLMQYTGLKDKNRKEIFEGDIIAYDEQFMSNNGENLPNFIDIRIEPNYKYYDGSIGERRWGRKIEIVKWENSSCGFEPFSDSQSNCGHCGGGINSNDIEVIGNIYENENLIDN